MDDRSSVDRLVCALRAGAVVLLLTLAITASLGPVSTASASTGVPTQGIFEDCPLSTHAWLCASRLFTMYEAGIRVVVFPATDGTPTQLAWYAAGAEKLGMKVMWSLSDSGWWTGGSVSNDFPLFAQACHCSSNFSLMWSMVRFLGSLPATYGYYAVDDSAIAPGQHDAIAAYVAAIKSLDPNHPVILSSNQESQTDEYENVGDMNAAEIYPVTTSSLTPVSANQDVWGGVAQEITDDQATATAAGKPSVFILQAFTFGDNLTDGEDIGVCTPADTTLSCYDQLQYPTESDQLQLRNEVLAHAHPQLILWWSFPGTFGAATANTSSVYPTGATASSRWAGLSAAIQAPAPVPVVAHIAQRPKPKPKPKHKRRRHRP